jgi:hypothetical protein
VALLCLCNCRPAIISYILAEAIENFDMIQSAVFNLFIELPISKWTPTIKDIDIVENMLKDPIISLKSKLGRFIVDKINWEENFDISLQLHKKLALSLANIHLDNTGRRNSHSGYSEILNVAYEVTTNFSNQKSASITFSDWCA